MWRDILSTVGDVQCHVGYYDKRGGHLEYRGDIMMHVGDTRSTVGVFSTVSGYRPL